MKRKICDYAGSFHGQQRPIISANVDEKCHNSRTDPFKGLTNMFRAVGQVMHLLEDTSQPQHVRNEQHLDKFPFIRVNTPWRSPIEDYGNENVDKLNYGDGSMLDWRGAGFTQLEDFWDRHLYNGNSAALDDAENPVTLFTNTWHKIPQPNQKCHFSRTDPAAWKILEF